jgi:hypothetical protein
MRVSAISFCNTTGYNIRSDESKKFILDRIEKRFGIKIIAKHYEKYCEPKSLDILNKNPHMVCLRSNGNPYLLLLTRHNNMDLSIFVDKKIQQGYFLPRMITYHLMFGKNKQVHDDTIFDGEMVKTKDGKWLYIINDLIVCKGTYLSDVNLVKRLNMVYDLLDTEYIPDELCPFKIVVKKYFTYDEIKSNMMSHINIIPYTCRGLYFKPLFLKFKDILINFDDSLIKKVKRDKIGGGFQLQSSQQQVLPPSVNCQVNINQITDNSDDQSLSKLFWTRKTSSPDVYDMIDTNNNIIGSACIPGMKVSKYMREVFAEKNMVDKVQLSYLFNDRFQKWVPLLPS